MSALKAQLTDAMKGAMKAKEKDRLGAIRLILAALKQKEVDDRVDLTDQDVITILTKMVKQRRDSIAQYTDAGRDDLVAQEQYELDIISEFLPEPLSEEEVASMVEAAIAESGAESMRDMGKVMGILKPKLEGRADMGKVSGQVKAKLG